MTINGRKDAKDIAVGDVLISMEINDEAVNDPNFDWIAWSQEGLALNETNIRTTTVIGVSAYNTSQLYLLNGDLYSESHYILTKKDNVSKFIRVDQIDNSYMVYSYSELGFINIESLEVVEYEDTVYSINCEPYDNFFTENMLVFDARDQQS
jgi:regulatory protein YycI of two-component signal transduction system YycFG